MFHCPFCDGWEVRDRPLAVHGNGPAAAESALFVSGWSSDVVLFTGIRWWGSERLNTSYCRALLNSKKVRYRPLRRMSLNSTIIGGPA